MLTWQEHEKFSFGCLVLPIKGEFYIVLAEQYDRDDLPLKVLNFLLEIQTKLNEDEMNKFSVTILFIN